MIKVSWPVGRSVWNHVFEFYVWLYGHIRFLYPGLVMRIIVYVKLWKNDDLLLETV